MGFGVWGLGFGVWGLGFGVWGLGLAFRMIDVGLELAGGWVGGGGGGGQMTLSAGECLARKEVFFGC